MLNPVCETENLGKKSIAQVMFLHRSGCKDRRDKKEENEVSKEDLARFCILGREALFSSPATTAEAFAALVLQNLTFLP